MKFAIDVVYLDRKKKVRKTRPGMVPRRISGCLLAHSVLELPVGVIESSGTQAGDQLSFDEKHGLIVKFCKSRFRWANY